ncbi:MAG TPA: oligopeptide/dipeptide ABC transporter ATP-binding protein [Aliidongia sp.]|uniref:ABC transporter ATP-binding protein n=1 Tax=Aliidongia sp. TaxID=1914230 RepID=UPI002DDD9112|nr:oligopeptide/dipeptide ABC transporter ATP-binding protein [Aliidongia sp.]HEV2673029.1 oligopeptide/dipeptide ABC transporter ATP-binding protein [Aliidongia sp.]
MLTKLRPMPAQPDAIVQPLLRVDGLRKHFPIRGGLLGRVQGHVKAVDGVSFEVHDGETLGIVGESGCGKSTLARLLIRLIEPDSGNFVLEGSGSDNPSARALRRRVQMVFQDSYATLNPRLTIEDSIAFGLKANGSGRTEAKRRVHEVLDMVGLLPAMFAERYPHELSGGQRQRVNIARALALGPRLLILDEAVSALDKSVEAQVLNQLQGLKRRLGLTYIFISHDLNVVQYVSDRVLVMYLGKAIEVGPVGRIYEAPLHPYTRGLLSSRLPMDPRRRVSIAPLSGDPPNPIDPPSGCRFRTRCPIAETLCAEREPQLARAADGHVVACHACQPGSGHSLARVKEAAPC